MGFPTPRKQDDLWRRIEDLIGEIEKGQQDHLMSLGRRIVPGLTEEDVLQPFDYPELENHPHFRYEEGVLAGVKTLAAALSALRKSL